MWTQQCDLTEGGYLCFNLKKKTDTVLVIIIDKKI